MAQEGSQTIGTDQQGLYEEAARVLTRINLSGVRVDQIERFKAEENQIQTFLRVRVPVESVEQRARSVLAEMDDRLDAMAEEAE